MEIKTEDLYADMLKDIDYYDTHEYPKGHPLFSMKNKKVVGKMKVECNGKLALEFGGLRSKMYSLLLETQISGRFANISKAKGVTKVVVKKILKHENFMDCISIR